MCRPPIALFVYNRPRHTRQTVVALSKNEGSAESELFIYSDGPRKPGDEGAILEVREYLLSVDGFKSVTIVERDRNLGLACSIITGVTEMLERFEKVIVLEDDMVTSPYFLRFMNDALRNYADDDHVGSIQGYQLPLGVTLQETYFLRYVGCWGWGTWRRAWELFEPDGRRLIEKFQSKKERLEFDVDGSYPFFEMLERQSAGELDSWAIRWHASLFLAEKLSLYPSRSLVCNTGHDGSGVHCNCSSHFEVLLADMPVPVGHEKPIESSDALKALTNYFRTIHRGLIKQIVQTARQLFHKMGF